MSDHPRGILAERYRLVSVLGEGGMGRVWEARDELLGRDVAIKEIVPGGLSERAIREARAIAMVTHPHVVRVFDVVSQDGVPWIVMELVRSRSLMAVVKDEGPMEPRRVARIGLELLAALQAAHRAGILHRDVKPANVLLAGDGRAVLTDFGLAAVAGDSGMTRTGVVLGSPSYLAPERALDAPAGPSSDLWSLGATLFTAVEGHPPYGKSSPMATLASLMVDPAPVPQRAGALRPALEALLKKDPAERADAAEAERLLRAAASGVAPKKRSKRLLVAGLAAIAVAIPVAVLVTGGTSPQGTTAQAAPQDFASPDPSRSTVVRRPVPSGPAPSASPAPLGKRPSVSSSLPPALVKPPATKAVPAPVKPAGATLTAAFNNVGVSDDGDTLAGNFDGGGASYSAQALAAAGATPGRTLTVGGVALTWPSTAGTGRKDNVIAAGQTITVPGSGATLAFLVAADYGGAVGDGRITYTDGATQTYTLAVPDWLDDDPTAVVAGAYQNRAGAERYDRPATIFGATVALTEGKTVSSVRLPAVGAVPAREGTTTLHIFAARIG